MTHRNDGKGTGKGQLGRPRRGSAAFAVLTLVLASLPCRTDPAGAQALPRTGSRAVLVRSDPAGKGLPFLPLPNAFPASYGEYRLEAAASGGSAGAPPAATGGGTAGDARAIRVWFTRSALYLGDAWRTAACGSLFVAGARAREFRPPAGPTVLVLEYPDYRLFVEAPSGLPGVCELVAALADRVAYFLRYAPDAAGFSLPAVVDYRATR